MFLSRSRIPCYVLIYDQLGIIKKSLDFLTKYSDRLEIVVIENPSKNTPEISRYVADLGKRGCIARYYLFDENITGTAYTQVFEQEINKIRRSKFILITDGDLVADKDSWLSEELHIMKNKNIFACGISLSLDNLPVQTFPEAKNWIPSDINVYPDYNEALTGGHLLMLRGKEFAKFMTWREKNNLNFVDGIMHRYAYDLLGKQWARTKSSSAYHLTWDLYNDKNHPYTKLKTGKSFNETWHHTRRTSFKLTSF